MTTKRLDERSVLVAGLYFAAASFLLVTVPSAVFEAVLGLRGTWRRVDAAVCDALDVDWGDDDD